jgi:hypothetical protein
MPSYLSDFANDLFISYTHIDNEPLAHGKDGWVSTFHTALRARLRQLLGAELEIWRDAKLQGNDYLSDALLKQFPKIAILVSILSPRYIQSEWCLKELQEFAHVAERTGGLRIDDKARIYKVVKTLIPREQHPPELQGLLGYEFFDLDAHTGRPKEFLPELGKEEEYKFFQRLDDLAYDVHLLLKELKARATSTHTHAAMNGKAVFLAQTTNDVREVYDGLRRELLAQQCRVLPEGELPLHNPDALKQRVRADLERCKFSIHLVGQNYSIVPEGEAHSLIEIQHELAEEHSRAADFWRVIWLRPGLQNIDGRQQNFINALRHGGRLLQRADFLETSLEELHSTILAKLRNGKTLEARPPAPSGLRRVYMICDQADVTAALPVADHLFDAGFEVDWPAFEGEETALRTAHENKMQSCDAALIFCGASTDAWLDTKLAHLRKVYGWEPKREPLKAQAVYFAGPQKIFKDIFKSREAHVIKNFGAFAPEDLREFIAALRAAGNKL